MDLKIYKVTVVDDCSYYVIAYSWEHALVMVAEMVEEFPDEYSEKDIKEIEPKHTKDIIIDYNYITDKEEKETLNSFYKKCIKSKVPMYGVVTDDFVAY